ncbi:MAG: carbon-nitrogen hydrolase family protein [Saccharospirillum sp.]|nr:carbon-nitrogen hydrolase family protein [Saccharospirillum sp.]
MKWYLAQMISSRHFQDNLERVHWHLQQAANQGCDAVQLPEMFATFGLAENQVIARAETDFNGEIGAQLRDWSRQFGLWLVAGTVPVQLPQEDRPRARLHVLDAEGELRASYDKIHLFDASVSDSQRRYQESRHYQPGDEVVTVSTPWGVWGLSVCYDLRFPELYRRLADAGAETLVAPSAFTWVTGQAHWQVLCRARAIENGCYLLAANQGGQHDEKRRTWGHSLMCDPWGEVTELAEGEGGLCVSTDPERVREIRTQLPVHEHRRL